MAPKKQEVTSQSTPLATDILEMLRGQIAEGSFGTGAGPLQQEAGTAMRQFVNSGGGEFDLSPLMKQLEDMQNRRTESAVGNQREAFGIAGNRFGSTLQTGEGRLREGLEGQFATNIGSMLLQDFTNRQNRLMNGIGMMQGMGDANMAPFMQLASQGINPDVFTENPWMTGLKTVAGGIKGAAEGVASLKKGG